MYLACAYSRLHIFSLLCLDARAHSNLHNNQEVIPDFMMQLREVLFTIGWRNVFVSIYESGSADQTKNYLRFMEILLGMHYTGTVLCVCMCSADIDVLQEPGRFPIVSV